ncbi:hypothetical protein GF325_07380 [Candidatus Bathyarchaeota archaeon]|nr:hypothetical protein [Candidatus Bathyarchaeota archaeon]
MVEHPKIKAALGSSPFILSVGYFDKFLGPSRIDTFPHLGEIDDPINQILKDTFNTKNDYISFDFPDFYAQVMKFPLQLPGIEGETLFCFIMIRDASLPKLGIAHLKQIKDLFLEVPEADLLKPEQGIYNPFFISIYKRFVEKKQPLPLELFSHHVRAEITTIQGFCEYILKNYRHQEEIQDEVYNFIELMLESCYELSNVFDELA